MKRVCSLVLIVFLVLTPALTMVAVLGANPTIRVVDDETVPQDAPEEDVELTAMFFTETASSDGGLYYVCRRGTDAVAYFGESMVKYLSGGTVFTLEFPGSNLVLPAGETPTGSKTNYLYGNDPSLWKTGIVDYSTLRYADIYPGIDLVYKIQDGNLKYEFVVMPFADAELIQLEYVDADSIGVDGRDLVITKNGDEIRDTELRVFQGSAQKSEVPCQYSVFSHRRLRFHLGAYDSAKQVVIDPVIQGYSTYLGGPAEDSGEGIAVEDGYAYVTGHTGSSAFPTMDPYQGTKGGGHSCFVTKFSRDGRSLIYSTFLGGTDDDYGMAIAVEDGYAYMTGRTESSDFPVFNAIDSTHNSFWDAFITKIAQDGQSLVYSTYLGGSHYDYGQDIAVEDGYAYVTGYTYSTDFPTVNAYNATINSGYDCFVTKFSIDGQSLVYSTYLGGSNVDHGYSIDVEEGCAYVAGDTSSHDFPMANAYDSTIGGFTDCFVTKFAVDGQSLVYSTYLGGSEDDTGLGIDVEDGSAYVAGSTGGDFPTVSAFDSVHNGLLDVFVAKLASDGQSLVYSTYIGDNESDIAHDIAVENGFAYVIGETQSPLFPMVKTYSSPYEEHDDCFVTQLALDGSYFIYSTAIGGIGNDRGRGIAVEDGRAYITGFSSSGRGFPMINAFDGSYNGGGGDCFVAMLVDDSDSDGLSDSQELTYGTNPYLADTDNDNFLDRYEITYGSNATDASDYPAIPQEWYDAIYEDLDGNATLIQQIKDWLDGNYTAIQTLFTYVEGNATLLLDTVALVGDNTDEIAIIAALATANYDWLEDLNATAIEDIALIQEVIELLGVSVGDGDYDGLDDLTELSLGTDILCIDTDCDNLNDAFEVKLGTDPLDDDSDGDTYLDGLEYIAGTNPLDALDYPGAAAGPDNLMLYVIIGSASVVVVVILGLLLRKRRAS